MRKIARGLRRQGHQETVGLKANLVNVSFNITEYKKLVKLDRPGGWGLYSKQVLVSEDFATKQDFYAWLDNY